MTLSAYDLPVMYLNLKLSIVTNYMIGYAHQYLMLIHIVRVREFHNGCTALCLFCVAIKYVRRVLRVILGVIMIS